MAPTEPGLAQASTATGWAGRPAAVPVLFAAATALFLMNIPLTTIGGHPDYVWSSVSVVTGMWQIWRRGWGSRAIWAIAIAVAAATLVSYGLGITGVIGAGGPHWWIPVASAADIVALVILLSPPIRHWVASRPR